MPTKKQPAASTVNKPFVLICLFVASTLTGTLWQGHEAPQEVAVQPAQMADAGHALPACGMVELSLTAQCKPRRDA